MRPENQPSALPAAIDQVSPASAERMLSVRAPAPTVSEIETAPPEPAVAATFRPFTLAPAAL